MNKKIMFSLMLLCCLFGCAHRLEIHQLPPGSEDFLPSKVGVVIPAILKVVEVKVNRNEVDLRKEDHPRKKTNPQKNRYILPIASGYQLVILGSLIIPHKQSHNFSHKGFYPQLVFLFCPALLRHS